MRLFFVLAFSVLLEAVVQERADDEKAERMGPLWGVFWGRPQMGSNGKASVSVGVFNMATDIRIRD